MKANKIVFSTIAALALSSSAFAEPIGDYKLNESWDEQVYSADAWTVEGSQVSIGHLADLGWSEGKDAISALITGASDSDISNLANNGGLLGGINKQLDGTKAKLNVDYTSNLTDVKYDFSGTGGNINAYDSAQANYTLTMAVNDYIKVSKALKAANDAKTLYDNLSAENTLKGSVAGASFEIHANDDKAKIVAAIKKIDPTKQYKTYKTNNDWDTTEIQNDVKALFNGALKGYAANAAFKAVGDDISKLETLLDTINTNAGKILSTDNLAATGSATTLSKLRADLALAVEGYKKYSESMVLIDGANDRIDAAKTEILSLTNSTTDYKYAARTSNADDSSEILENKEAIKANIQKTAKDATKFDVKDNATKWDGSSATGISAAIKYLEEDKSLSDTSDDKNDTLLGTSKKAITSNQLLYKTLKIIETAINNGDKIEFKKTDGFAKDETVADIMGDLVQTDGVFAVSSSSKLSAITKELINDYNAAIDAIDAAAATAKFTELANAKKALADLESELVGKLDAVAKADEKVAEALGDELGALAKTDAGMQEAIAELKSLKTFVDTDGKTKVATKENLQQKVTNLGYSSIGTSTSEAIYKEYGLEVEPGKLDEAANVKALKQAIADRYKDEGVTLDGDTLKVNGNAFSEAEMKNVIVIHHNKKIQKAADNIAAATANAKKDSLAVEGLSTLNIQLNNMNKRLGEIRGMDGEIGVWLRTWGGKMSADNDSFKYYSTQLGADKKTAMKDGDLYLGVLVGYDNVKSDIKSNAYSVGAYASYIDNSGFFADGVMKFVSTKNERSGYNLSNQQTLLASIEGGYRFDMSDGFYVEPSLEFVTGHVGEYKSVKDGTTLKVDSFTPVVFKPQVFVGGSADAFSYRAGVGGVLSAQGQDASVTIANLAQNLDKQNVNGSGSVKLSKNNHGFASIGGSFKASENFRINLGVERSFGGDLTNDYEVNMTLRYGF